MTFIGNKPKDIQAFRKDKELSQIDFTVGKVPVREFLREHKRKQRTSLIIIFFILVSLLVGIAEFGSHVFAIEFYLSVAAIFASSFCLKMLTGSPIFTMVAHLLIKLTPVGKFQSENFSYILALKRKIRTTLKQINLSEYEELSRLSTKTEDKFDVIMAEKQDLEVFTESNTLMFILLELLLELQDLSRNNCQAKQSSSII